MGGGISNCSISHQTCTVQYLCHVMVAVTDLVMMTLGKFVWKTR